MSLDREKVPVTKPFLPPREEFKALVDEVWDRNWLTNNGPLVQRLEKELEAYLGVPHLRFLTNGTIALQLAIKALGLKGEIITTPFSYVATTSSIVWEGCKPVFVDIDSQTLNIDTDLIETAITENTSGILATHVFGNPCNIESIQKIADRHDLKVIYDAAHCFGTKYKGESVFNFGDISTSSFHATKLYHTIEGGAIITKSPDIDYRITRMRNFGHAGFGSFDGVGINGKNSELHAAMGLINLQYFKEILKCRKYQWNKYQDLLENANLRSISLNRQSDFNYAYYPAIFNSEKITLSVKEHLEQKGISPRRYFYPSLSELDYVTSSGSEISKDISKRILCLPLYHSLEPEIQVTIAETILQILKKE